MPDGVNMEEWNLTPLVPPMVKCSNANNKLLTIKFSCFVQLHKRKIDSFRPGRTIQCRQLVATLSKNHWTVQTPQRFYHATLRGAKEPENQMVIIMDPYDPHNQGIGDTFW